MKVKKILTGLLFLSFVAIGSQSCQKTEEDDDNQSTEQPAEITETAFGLNLKLVKVNGGTFQMGSDIHSDESPIHTVTLSSFYIGKCEVTQAQWKAVMGNNPSYFSDCDDCPVERVSWYDVKSFLQKLNQVSGRNYTLPTEAQWEYAAGGGANNRTKYAGTSDKNSVINYAWYDPQSNYQTHPVGTKQENTIGIFDMSGNVAEWCSDWYGAYDNNSQINPIGAINGTSRINRGGSWFNGFGSQLRVSDREKANPEIQYASNLGFRVALIQ